MPELTIFTLPKPFTEPHVTLIQRNALASWRRLGREVEVLVIGDDEGVAAAAREHGAVHIGGAVTNEYGTPLLDWAFARAAERGSSELLCYVNADIVLLEDFLAAVRRLPRGGQLGIGQRWDCDVNAPLDFDAPLRDWARRTGKLDIGFGSDYFVFPRTTEFELPAFAVGRPRWDNWMIGRALEISLPVIDMTPSTTVIHQNHGYGHVQVRRGSKWDGPEADRNLELAGRLDRYMHSPRNATHVLTPGGLRRARTPRYLRARLEEFLVFTPTLDPVRPLIRRIRHGRPSAA